MRADIAANDTEQAGRNGLGNKGRAEVGHREIIYQAYYQLCISSVELTVNSFIVASFRFRRCHLSFLKVGCGGSIHKLAFSYFPGRAIWKTVASLW
jgi:hypothetical protein